MIDDENPDVPPRKLGSRTKADESSAVSDTTVIHTMPKRFVGVRGKPSTPAVRTSGRGGGGSKRGLIIAIAAFVVVGLLVGGAFLFTRLAEQNTNSSPLANVQVNTSVPVTLPNASGNASLNANGTFLNTNTAQNNANIAINSTANANTSINSSPSTNTTNSTIGNTNAPGLTPTDSTDTDRDGLTDAEERLYNTVNTKSDSDNDSFLDREELLNLYNPSGPGLLRDAPFIDTYNGSAHGFTVLYPSDFLVQPTGLNNNEVIFSYSSTGEFIQVRVVDNPSAQTARDWYLDNDPTISPSQVTDITVGTLKGVQSADGFTRVLADNQRIFVFQYDFGGQLEINFRTTFSMLVTSFTQTSTAPGNSNNNTNSNTNTNSNANTSGN